MLNRKLHFLVSLCCIYWCSCHQATENNSPITSYPSLPALIVPWTSQNSIVCFGTSLTYGYGAGEKKGFIPGPIWGGSSGNNAFVGDSSYPRFLQEKLRINVFNQGYVGARASYGITLLQDSVLSKNPVLVLLEFGANEFLQNVAVHDVDSVLSLLIVDIAQSGSQVVLVSFINPDMTRFMGSGYWTTRDSIRAIEYYNMLSNLSIRYSLPFIDYPLRGVFGYPQLMSDNLHPNGAGYKIMEENIYQALSATFQKNGMLK
jgi:lysophospholipase L1-like esterase